MDKETGRNTIIFIIAVLGMFFAYQQFVIRPAQQAAQVEAERQAEAQTTLEAGTPGIQAPDQFVSVDEALARNPRIELENDRLVGSLNLRGAKLDELFLRDYNVTIDEDSPQVELLRPQGAEYAYFATSGWVGQNLPGLPDSNTLWTAPENARLGPDSPLTLTFESEQFAIERTIEIDDTYMFTVTDRVTNKTDVPVTIAPYGTVQRIGTPPVDRNIRAAEGYVRYLGEDGDFRLKLRRYNNWKKDGDYIEESDGGWFGISDKYWVTLIVPDQDEHFRAELNITTRGDTDIYSTSFTGEAVSLPAGGTTTDTYRMYSGAKEAGVLADYQNADDNPVPNLISAIDWGFGYFLTKPVFWTIKWFQGFVGNFGVAILMMTVLVKLLFFYPANISFESMTKMKKVQPQLEKLKEKNKDDPAAMQQEMMKLYREEKINPLLGCLPMLATIPVFLALFHVLNTTVEMRHEPFFGWIQDLSARDPLSIWTLFGLLPYNPANVPLVGGILDGFLHLGPWPLLYGVTMWMTTQMNPSSPDPTQKMIMNWLPLIFTFVLAQFAAGLLIYYTWSNILTILQQYVIMRRFKVDNPIDGTIRRLTGKPKPAG